MLKSPARAWHLPRLRAYERPIVAAILALTAALAILIASLGATPGALGSDGPPALCAPVRDLSEGEGATRPDVLYATTADETKAAGDAILTVAADSAGRFALYGTAPSGRVQADPYEVLDACPLAPAESGRTEAGGPAPFGNALSARVEAAPSAGNPPITGPQVVVLGQETLLSPTRPSGDASLTTRHRLPGDVAVEQRLSLGADGHPEDLTIRYLLENRAEAPRTVSVRSTMTPPAQNPADLEEGRAPFVAPAVANEPGEPGYSPYGLAVRTERALVGSDVGIVEVPRAGASSDSSGMWSPGPAGPAPDLVGFAPTDALLASPFGYEPRHGAALPRASSVAAYWLDLRLAPGASVELSERYETPAAPWGAARTGSDGAGGSGPIPEEPPDDAQ